MINKRNRRGWATRKENRTDETGVRKIPDSTRNISILPFRVVPLGAPGNFPGGWPLTPTNTHHGNAK